MEELTEREIQIIQMMKNKSRSEQDEIIAEIERSFKYEF